MYKQLLSYDFKHRYLITDFLSASFAGEYLCQPLEMIFHPTKILAVFIEFIYFEEGFGASYSSARFFVYSLSLYVLYHFRADFDRLISTIKDERASAMTS
jgi:hypothetical protein